MREIKVHKRFPLEKMKADFPKIETKKQGTNTVLVVPDDMDGIQVDSAVKRHTRAGILSDAEKATDLAAKLDLIIEYLRERDGVV